MPADAPVDANPSRTNPAAHLLSSRAGYMPIPLRHTPWSAFEGLAVHLRHDDVGTGETFTLYRAADVQFSLDDRARLLQHGHRYVYIRISDHDRFRVQLESNLQAMCDDESSAHEKSAVLYETSVELITELLGDTNLDTHSAQLSAIAKCVTGLTLNNPDCFAHLFDVSRHDLYTATHLVNVGTWMVPLAYALGITDPLDLARTCQAGLLHDVGKLFLPPDVLNKPGRLSNEEWQQIQRHPQLGADHLTQFETVHPLTIDVCAHHHERLDGSGYPDKLTGQTISLESRICAVVDSFDAMTSLRPFKDRALSVSEAIIELRSGVPEKYDADVVAAWIGLLRDVDDRTEAPAASVGHPSEQRRHKRFACNCAAQAMTLTQAGTPDPTREPVDVTVVDVSRSGIGLRSPIALETGSAVRLTLLGNVGGLRSGRTVRGIVVWCQARDAADFGVGVEILT